MKSWTQSRCKVVAKSLNGARPSRPSGSWRQCFPDGNGRQVDRPSFSV
jgi:hypothetical protein